MNIPYTEAEKDKVIDSYLEGTPRREISEKMGIPPSTVRSWTKDIVPTALSSITCVVCGKKKRTPNIQQIYCSNKCKNRANYQRRLKRANKALGPRSCDRCGKEYQPKHGNARYCQREMSNPQQTGSS